jgi:hypothetical protein
MIIAKGSSWDGSSDGTSNVYADVADKTIGTYSADGAITEMAGVVIISKASAAAMTLTIPVAGGAGVGDDGKKLKIISTTNYAHVITCAGGFMPGASTVTLAAEAGTSCTLEAYNGYWYIGGVAAITTTLTGLTQSGSVNLIVGTKTTGISLPGAYTTGILMAGGTAYNPIQVGTKDNAANAGLVLVGATDDAGGVMVFCDDGGATLGSVTAPIWTRYLITVAQAGGATATGLYSQLKTYGAITCTTGSFTALKAYNQAGTVTLLTGAEYGVINAGVTLEGNLVNTSGTFSGVDVNINTSTHTITDTAVDTAGIIIRKTSASTYGWPVALKIDRSVSVSAIRIGNWKAAAASGNGVLFAAGMDSYTGTDGQFDVIAAFGESTSDLTNIVSAKVARFRHVINTGTTTTINHETYGVVGQLVAKQVTLGHLHAGVLGTLEGNTTAFVSNGAYTFSVAAVMGRIGGSSLITATKYVSGVSAFWNCTTSIDSAAFSACSVGTATWKTLLAAENCTNLLYVPDATTAYENAGIKVGSITTIPDTTSSGVIRIYVGGTPYYIPIYAAGSISGL